MTSLSAMPDLPTMAQPMMTQPAARPPRLAKGMSLEQIDAKAKEFESMVVGQLMSFVWEGVGVDPNFGGGRGEEMFRGMMVTEYSKQMTKRGGFGIADSVRRQMLQMQEV
ncbi:putative Chemotactic signal-response protein CheL [uncultured Gammaproteobacteria bacterium]